MQHYESTFPGITQNPAWDRHDHRNVHFAIACFGYHLCVDLIVVLVAYLLAHFAVRAKWVTPCNGKEEGRELLADYDSDKEATSFA